MRNVRRSGLSDVKVLISNVYSDDNKGGAAITMSTVEAAKRVAVSENIGLIPITKESDYRFVYRHTLERHPDLRLLDPIVTSSPGVAPGLRSAIRAMALVARPARSRSATVREIATNDVVIGKGGQMLGKGRFGLRGSLGLLLSSCPLLLASRLGKTTVLYSVTIGPFQRLDPGRLVARALVRRCHLVFARDAASLEEARRLGAPTDRLYLMPDCVFAIPPPAAAIKTTIRRTLGLNGARTGFLVIHKSLRNHRPDMFQILRSAWLHVLDRRLVDRVILVLHYIGDRDEARAFVEFAQDERFQLLETDFSPEELLALYAEGEVVVSGRVHGALLSLVAGTPAFALEPPNSKAKNILGEVGLGDYVINISQLDDNALGEAISRVIAEPQVKVAIMERVADARSRVSSSREELRSRILDHLTKGDSIGTGEVSGGSVR